MEIQTNVESIKCWDTSSCRHLNANCADKISCHLQCDGTSTCRNAKLSGSWNLDCSGTSSCRNLNANCADKKSCHSLCDGTSTCRNAKLYGPWDLDCSGTKACQNSQVQKPTEATTTTTTTKTTTTTTTPKETELAEPKVYLMYFYPHM